MGNTGEVGMKQNNNQENNKKERKLALNSVLCVVTLSQ